MTHHPPCISHVSADKSNPRVDKLKSDLHVFLTKEIIIIPTVARWNYKNYDYICLMMVKKIDSVTQSRSDRPPNPPVGGGPRQKRGPPEEKRGPPKKSNIDFKKFCID